MAGAVRDLRPDRLLEVGVGTGLMLATAFAASIGGMATPVGTPPNLIGITFINSATGGTAFRKPVDNIGTKTIPDYAAYALTADPWPTPTHMVATPWSQPAITWRSPALSMPIRAWYWKSR